MVSKGRVESFPSSGWWSGLFGPVFAPNLAYRFAHWQGGKMKIVMHDIKAEPKFRRNFFTDFDLDFETKIPSHRFCLLCIP